MSHDIPTTPAVHRDTHPKMLEYFAGADTDNLPDVYFRPIPVSRLPWKPNSIVSLTVLYNSDGDHCLECRHQEDPVHVVQCTAIHGEGLCQHRRWQGG